MLSRTGWGENATGGTNIVMVSTMAQLKNASSAGGNWILLAPNFGTQDIGTSSIVIQDNTTIDGSLAPGATITNNLGQVITIRVLGDNTIQHCFILDADPNIQTTAMSLINGLNHWVDHIEFRNFESDDGLNIGQSSPNNNVDLITISNVKFDDTDFGGVSGFYFDKEYDAGNLGRITVHSSDLSAEQRNPKNEGMTLFHEFNNLMRDPQFNSSTVRNRNAPSVTATTWAENNHYVTCLLYTSDAADE